MGNIWYRVWSSQAFTFFELPSTLCPVGFSEVRRSCTRLETRQGCLLDCTCDILGLSCLFCMAGHKSSLVSAAFVLYHTKGEHILSQLKLSLNQEYIDWGSGLQRRRWKSSVDAVWTHSQNLCSIIFRASIGNHRKTEVSRYTRAGITSII